MCVTKVSRTQGPISLYTLPFDKLVTIWVAFVKSIKDIRW